MVVLTNIKTENGYITAHAINRLSGTAEDIKAKLDGTYHSSVDPDIVKATWNIVVEYEGTGKLPERAEVAWG